MPWCRLGGCERSAACPAFWRMAAGTEIGRVGVLIQPFPGDYLVRALSLSADQMAAFKTQRPANWP
jgi:hypothetical protein